MLRSYEKLLNMLQNKNNDGGSRTPSVLDQKRINLVLNTRSLLVKIDAKQIGKLNHGRVICLTFLNFIYTVPLDKKQGLGK